MGEIKHILKHRPLFNKILLMGSDEKDGRQNGLVVGHEGRKPINLYTSECAATYTVEGDTTPGSSFGGKNIGDEMKWG